MFEIFPSLGWLSVLLAVAIAVATRRSDVAIEARSRAGISLNWLLLPAVLSWLLLATVESDLWKTHVILFGLELLIVLLTLPRYRSWLVMPFLLASACLIWSGAIAVHNATMEHPYRIGEEFQPPMGASHESVSKVFKRHELELVFARAQQFASSGALNDFNCGDSLPPFRMSAELIPEGEYRERQVSLHYVPDLVRMNEYRCLDRGIDYLFEQAVREIDLGPPIDYGYKSPSTGKPLYEAEWDQPRKPICRCDLRASGREWVAYSDRAAAELR
jgi:hypothetical protein